MIQIKVKLFTVLKEEIGSEELVLEVPEKSSCEDVILKLEKQWEKLTPVLERSFVAVNGMYASRREQLETEDELAILPPVSGG